MLSAYVVYTTIVQDCYRVMIVRPMGHTSTEEIDTLCLYLLPTTENGQLLPNNHGYMALMDA